jgi:hypothetical protein
MALGAPLSTDVGWCRDPAARLPLAVGRAFIARDAADDAVSWIATRFDGQPAPRDCNK